MSRTVLKLLNKIYGWVMGLVIMGAVVYAGYAIWDNAQIYQAAKDVTEMIRLLRPDEDDPAGPGFDELRRINGDVVAWITVKDTNIDYPVLQGENNLEYMNKDVYGDFSLAGSIFLDTRNSADFSDPYSLVYGHNMDQHLMFGDLALFKEERFFREHTDAVLMVPGRKSDLKVLAVMQLSAGTDEIFNPHFWDKGLAGLDTFMKDNSLWYHADLLAELARNPEAYKIVTLATCSDGSTDDRTVIELLEKNPEEIPEKDPEKEKPVEIPSKQEVPFIPELEDPTEPETKESEEETIPETIGQQEETPEETIEPIGNDDVTPGKDTDKGPKKTGDTTDAGFWIKMIAAIVVFIILFECTDCHLRKRKRDLGE